LHGQLVELIIVSPQSTLRNILFQGEQIRLLEIKHFKEITTSRGQISLLEIKHPEEITTPRKYSS